MRKTYPNSTLAHEIRFVYHQHIKHDLQYARLECLGSGLHLREEELEGIESHPLGIDVRFSVMCREVTKDAKGEERAYTCDETAQPETHEPFFTECELLALYGWYDQFSQYTLQCRVLFKGLNTSSLSETLRVEKPTHPVHAL